MRDALRPNAYWSDYPCEDSSEEDDDDDDVFGFDFDVSSSQS